MTIFQVIRFDISILYLAAIAFLSGSTLAVRPAFADRSIPQLQAAAEKGFVPQQIELAAAYFSGSGVQQDVEFASVNQNGEYATSQVWGFQP